jgi:hypothetical protein
MNNAPKMFLNSDVWGEIAKFNPGSNQGEVNQAARHALRDTREKYRDQSRRGVYFITEESMEQFMGEFEFPDGPSRWPLGPLPVFGNIQLIFPSFPRGVREKLTRLYSHLYWMSASGHHGVRRRVRALDITIREGDIAQLSVENSRGILERLFTNLDTMSGLEELKLDFSSLSLGVHVCTPFSILHKNCDLTGLALQTLCVDISGNNIGNRGCQWLMCYFRNTAIPSFVDITIHHEHCKTLYLGLRDNQINGFAVGLGDFQYMNELESLHIDLADNPLGDKGVDWLTRGFRGDRSFNGAPVGMQPGEKFDTLHLGLTNTGIGDEGLEKLCLNLSKASYLRHIQLDLGGNVFGVPGSVSLGELRANLLTLNINT